MRHPVQSAKCEIGVWAICLLSEIGVCAHHRGRSPLQLVPVAKCVACLQSDSRARCRDKCMLSFQRQPVSATEAPTFRARCVGCGGVISGSVPSQGAGPGSGVVRARVSTACCCDACAKPGRAGCRVEGRGRVGKGGAVRDPGWAGCEGCRDLDGQDVAATPPPDPHPLLGNAYPRMALSLPSSFPFPFPYPYPQPVCQLPFSTFDY